MRVIFFGDRDRSQPDFTTPSNQAQSNLRNHYFTMKYANGGNLSTTCFCQCTLLLWSVLCPVFSVTAEYW